MVFQLPEPVHGQTHIKLYRVTESTDAWVTARGYLGTLDGDDFAKEDSLRDVEIDLVQEDYRKLRDRAANAGGPSGEFRKADLINFVFDPATDAEFTWI